MPGPKYPPFPIGPKTGMGIPGNENFHNKLDPNSGGGPQGGKGFRGSVAPAKRGGFGHNGQQVAQRASMGGGRGSSGNPASRGGSIGSMQPDKRIAGHGGSPQTRSNIPAPANRGGFGHSGQRGVPGVRSNPQPSAGNTSGRSYKLIAGRFKRGPMGAQASQGDAMSGGRYGSAPVSTNT